MSTYTNDDNIRFLNDKNISQTLGDDTARQTNTVPSLDLLNEVNNALTAYDDRLCAYIDGLNEEYKFDETSPYLSVITKIQQVKGQLTGIESVELLSSHVKNLKEFVEDTIDSLDVATLSATNKFVRTLTEINGKIQATFTNVLSSDLEGQLQQTQVENLTTDLDSCYKKAGGLINGDAQVNGQLSVANDSIVNNDSTVRGNFIQGRGTSYTGDAEHSVVMGISASTNKDDVFLWNGKQNEAYTDHGRGTFNINAVSGVNGVFIGNQTLEKIVDDKREAARTQAKEYTDGVSAALSTDYVKKITIAKNEAINTAVNELAVPYVNSISTELSTDYVNKISTAKTQAIDTAKIDATTYTNGVSSDLSTDYVLKIQQASTNAINVAADDATHKVNDLDTNLSNVGVLVSSDLAFDYEESTRLITLNIKDYAGHNHTFTIDSARFIKGRIVDHVNIVEIDGQQVLRIWWTVEEGGTGVYSDVPLTTLAQVYHQGEGITIALGEDGYVISVNDTIVNKTFLNGKVAELNADIDAVNSKANTNTAKITSLAEISANHEGRISTLETGLTTANTNIATNAADITDANSHIASLETYATTLSAPDGQIKTLSGAIDTLSEYAHSHLSDRIALDEGKINEVSAHADRLQNYANTLSGGGGQIATLSNAIGTNTSDIALAAGNIAALQSYANTLSGGSGQIATLSNAIDANAANITTANGNINALQTYANSLSAPHGQIQTLSNAIDDITEYANDKISVRLSGDEVKIDAISAHAERLQNYANALSSDGGTINTLSNDIIQLSTSIIASDSFIGEIKVNYNNLTAGTAQAWVSQNGNTLSGVIKHFTLAPLGYVKQNTVIKVTYTNVPSNADRTKLANLKYITDDGIAFTDNDYIIIHGDFDQINLENITPSNVYYVNAVKRYELFELSNTVYKDYAWLSGNSKANSHAISGRTDFINDISVGADISAYGAANISGLTVRNVLTATTSNISVANKQITGVLSGTAATNAATYGQLTATLTAYYKKTETSSNAQLSTAINNLSNDYVSRKAADKTKVTEAGSFINVLANSFTQTGGGFRVCNSATASGEVNTNSFYTSYQLSCIRHHTNENSFRTFRLDNDTDNDSVVRKSTGASMLSASMFTALKTALLNAIYPVGSTYVDATAAVVCPIQTSLGGTWQNTGTATIQITSEGSPTDVPVWFRTA